MKQPDAVRERLALAWGRHWSDWLGGGGRWPLTIALNAPTEAEARRHWPQFQAWLRAWAAPEWHGLVRFALRSWSSLGPQQLPTHVDLAGPDEVVALLGPASAGSWLTVSARWEDRVAAWPDLQEPLRGLAGWFGSMTELDYCRFVAAFEWLASHPDSGLFVRQLPIAGLDSKWVEGNAGALARLLAARFGRPLGPLAEVAGLVRTPARRRIRLLDPELRRLCAGLSDVEVRLDELATLELPIRVAIVIENQQTALACWDLPGSILLMGGGFAVTELGQVPWLRAVPIVYWGDIDTAGFAILNALRQCHPHTVSCLMDEQALLKHRDLWSIEHSPTRSALGQLRGSEASLYERLLDSTWGRGVRLEQERIEWPWAWTKLDAAVSEVS